MDKENFYYNKIKNIIVNHKRFIGLDSILDNVIDDVYKHSYNVIKNIHNENIIESYLQRVVSTSLITVPKKLGINSKPKITQNNLENIITNNCKHKQLNLEAFKISNRENIKNETYNENIKVAIEEIIKNSNLDNIYNIYDLKFIKKLGIVEISKQLNIDKEIIVNTLEKFISIV